MPEDKTQAENTAILAALETLAKKLNVPEQQTDVIDENYLNRLREEGSGR